MQEITSSQNSKLKAALQLHSSRGRKKQGRFIVFGDRECRRALNTNTNVCELFLCEEMLSQEQLEFYQQHTSMATYSLPRTLMERLEFGERTDGVALIAERPDTDLDQLTPHPRDLTLVLESIEKPGNLGAILRSCDGAGVDTVIIADPRTDFYHHNCIRASMGSVFSMQLAAAPTETVLQYLTSNSFEVYAAIVDASTDFQQADFSSDRTAIVFGNEANGLSDVWRSSNLTSIFIPMRGIADSLNVSVSAAIVAYHAAGQRRAK